MKLLLSDSRSYLKRLTGTPFGVTLIIFVSVQMLFLTYAWLLAFQGVPVYFEKLQMVFFVICVHALVASNTAIYVVELIRFSPVFKPGKKELLVSTKSIVVVLLIVGVLISGLLSGYVGYSFHRGLWDSDSTRILVLNEVLSCLLFIIFVIADVTLYRACRRCIIEDSLEDAAGMEEVKTFANRAKNYALVCDGPGLFGMLLISIIGTALSPLLAGYYWHGFIVGAIGLHMAFSQSVLAFLSVIEV